MFASATCAQPPRSSCCPTTLAYTARDTWTYARQLSLYPAHTRPQPAGKRHLQAFFHTLKRDYVRVSPLPDALTALTSLARWIEDYNDDHPYSGLRMRSPREHRAMVSTTDREGPAKRGKVSRIASLPRLQAAALMSQNFSPYTRPFLRQTTRRSAFSEPHPNLRLTEAGPEFDNRPQLIDQS